MKPALTAEEWKTLSVKSGLYGHDIVSVHDGELMIDGGTQDDFAATDELHAVAALALHGTPEGFTHEMVDAIRYLADRAMYVEVDGIGDVGTLAVAAADRMDALLPPRSET